MDQTRCEQQQMTSCLTRFRSAPSSYFDTILNNNTTPPTPQPQSGYAKDDSDQPQNTQSSSGPNIQQAFARLIASMGAQDSSSCSTNPNLGVKQEPEAYMQQQSNMSNYGTGFVDNNNSSFGLMNSNSFVPMKMSTGVGNSSISRYNSSPAGFFDQFSIDSEFGAMRNYGQGGSNANAEASFSFPNTYKSEIGANVVKVEACSGDVNFNEDQTMDENYLLSFPMPSWDDLDILSDDFLKVTDQKPPLSGKAPDVKNAEGQSRPPGLLSHLSLPASSAELSAALQDSVPLRVRAKRGCATHPRSIAERVRRTKISERMRKLQELVPNMDKQTNTADMLDLAVDYIKDLEKQLKRLADKRSKCKCSAK